MAKGEEIVKYVTQKVVEYMETPPAERREKRLSRKQLSEPWTVRWFGQIPMALSLWAGRRRNKRQPSTEHHSRQGP